MPKIDLLPIDAIAPLANEISTTAWTARCAPDDVVWADNCQVREINDPTALADLAPTWARLVAETPGADFFYTLDWLEAYLRHDGRHEHLRVLVVSHDGVDIGILPLVVRTDSNRLGRFRVLTYPLNDWGSFYQPLGRRGETTLRAGLRHIAETPRDWDFLELRWVPSTGPEDDSMSAVLADVGFPSYKRPHTQTAIVDTRGPWDSYWSARSKNWRHNCKRNGNKLAKLGKVEFVRFRPAAGDLTETTRAWALYEQCEDLARCSWQGDSENGTTLTHESIRDFLHDVHATALRCGAIDISLLYIDQRPVAFQYSYFYRGRVSVLRSGFNADLNDFGPGTVLAHHVIRDCFERGDHTFDFLVGSLACKRPWLTSIEPSYRYSHYPRWRPRLLGLRLKRWLESRRGKRSPEMEP